MGTCRNESIIQEYDIASPEKILSRIILDRLRDAIDNQVRGEQLDFQRKRFCTDQIASLDLILDHSHFLLDLETMKGRIDRESQEIGVLL